MAEYIKREAAINGIIKIIRKSDMPEDWSKGMITAMSTLYRIPAADVRPVVRGKWTKEHLASTSGGTYPVVRCSVCGASLPFFEGTTYCPNCGADMREES